MNKYNQAPRTAFTFHRLIFFVAVGIAVEGALGTSINPSPVGGFEIGNGMIINRIGGYRFKVPGNWEAGLSGTLTQVIAPATVGIPRPQITIDRVKVDASKKFTDSDENLPGQPWISINVGGLEGALRVTTLDNGLRRAEHRLKCNETEYFLVMTDYGVASGKAELLDLLNRAVDSFQQTNSDKCNS